MTEDEFKSRIKVIKAINSILIRFNHGPLNTHDFDVLWDLDTSDLYQAQLEISKDLQMLSLQEN